MPRKVGGLIRMWKEIESDPDAMIIPNKSHCVVRSQSSPVGVMGWDSGVTTASAGAGTGTGRDGFGRGMMAMIGNVLTNGSEGKGLGQRRLRITGRQDEETLIQRFVNERMKEVELLKERRAVSEFVHRKKIQNFLIFKSSQKLPFSDHRPQSTAEEINQLNRGIAIFYLRRQFSPRAHRSGTPIPSVEKKSLFSTHLSNQTSSDSKSCEIRGNISHRTRHICTSSPIVQNKSMVDQLNLPKNSLDSENSEIRESIITKTHQSCIPLPTVEKKSMFPIHSSKNSLASESCEIKEQFSPRTQQIGISSSISEKKGLLPVHLPNNLLDTESSEKKRKFSSRRVLESYTPAPIENKSTFPTHLSNHTSANSKTFEIKRQFSSMAHQSYIPSSTVENKSMFRINVSKETLDSKNCEIEQFSARAQRSCASTPTVEKKSMFKLNLLKKTFDSKSCGSRQQFSPKKQQTCTSTPTIEDSKVLHTPLSDSHLYSNFHKIRQQFSPRPVRTTEKDVEAIRRYLDDVIQPEKDEFVNSRKEDFQENSSQHSDLAWEEREKSDDSSSLHSEQDEIDVDHNHQFGESDRMCFPGGFSSQRNNEDHREATLDGGFSETHSVSSEIDELKTRQKVTTISNDFREELNKVILSSLQKQWRNEENYVLNDECQPLESHGRKHSTNDDQSIKMEAIFDMRTDIANIQNEISDLRKLLTSYMQRNIVEHSSQQDDATATAPYSVSMGSPSVSSEWEPLNKGNCSICYENQIDSLLYRCGHLCTCYKCATELLWSSGRCPVCRIPIVDVVRAYSHS